MKAGTNLFLVAVLGLLALCGPAWAVEVNEPLSHWKFDETSGTTALDCVGDNNGTLVNGPLWTTGQIDGALSFDGVDDYVDCGTGPAITGTGDFTTSAWIMMPGGSSGAIVVQRSTTSANGSYGLSIVNGKVQFHIYNGGYGFLFKSDVTVNDGLWHHIVVVRTNSTDGEIYIDGSLAGSGSGPARSLNNVPVWIGRAFTVPAYFNGLIDDVRIYNRALSAEEIRQIYLKTIAIGNIEHAVDEKEKMLEVIDEMLEKELDAYDALEELLESGDYGDLKKGDIVKAMQKIHSARQHQEQSIDALEKSIEKLYDALTALGWEPEPEPSVE